VAVRRSSGHDCLDNGADWIKVYMTYRSWLDAHGDLVSQPTLTVEEPLRAGVKIAFGTDVGGVVWTDPIAQEFAREVEFGMTPMQAIH